MKILWSTLKIRWGCSPIASPFPPPMTSLYYNQRRMDTLYMQLKICLVNFLLLAITNTIVAIFVVRNNSDIYWLSFRQKDSCAYWAKYVICIFSATHSTLSVLILNCSLWAHMKYFLKYAACTCACPTSSALQWYQYLLGGNRK